jgi:hypothetical protein
MSFAVMPLFVMSVEYLQFPNPSFFTAVHISVLICSSTILMLTPLSMFIVFSFFHGSVTSGYPASSDLSFYYYCVSPFSISDIQVINCPPPFF